MSPSKSPLVIAVVDDDRDVLGSLRFLLEAEDFLVRTYARGSDCLSRLAVDAPDCFIIDYKMTEMDGIELAQQLRNCGRLEPIILITGYPDELIRHKARLAGIRYVVLKPHLDESLVTNVRVAIAHASFPRDIR